MQSVPTSNNMPKSCSVYAKRMAFLSQIFMKAKVVPNGPCTAYIFKKGRHSKPKSGATHISEEWKFVEGLGYIRADATPPRSRAAKTAGAFEGSSYSTVPVKVADPQIFPELIALSEIEGMEGDRMLARLR